MFVMHKGGVREIREKWQKVMSKVSTPQSVYLYACIFGGD